MTTVWNNGGGMQSAAIAAMIVNGDLPKPDFAVIADTGYERSSTWEYMDAVVAPALRTVGVEVIRVSQEFATVGLMGGKGGDTLLIPAFTDESGDVGKMSGFCSTEWKQRPIRRFLRAQGVNEAINWLGFSIDEVGRAVRSQKASANNGKFTVDFPLINAGMNRGDCIAYVERMGWPHPPRSSCWMCPNMHMQEWREVREHPQDWPKVVKFDRALRKIDPHVWLTDQCVPIDQASFGDEQEVMFGREEGGCESGQCFV